MISLLVGFVLNTVSVHAHVADVFTAGRNISERLEAQGNRVGSCTDVAIFTATRRALDGDHEYLGMTGVTAKGETFLKAEEYGRTSGYMPRVRQTSQRTFDVYTYRQFPFEFDTWGTRRKIMTLEVDERGTIVGLSVEGHRLCAGVAAPASNEPLVNGVPVPDASPTVPPTEGAPPASMPPPNAGPQSPGQWLKI